ncbi:MAG TPA: hypothetical protein VN715_00705 [Roseiarcus sp.]|nr:hypothetical protein [Roseiarcus sp.]
MTAALPDLSEAEFAAIRAVVMSTERGRRFLAEYARRRRAEDAGRLRDAIERIEAHAIRSDVERARQRLEGERAAEVVRQLAEVLKDLQPLADVRLRARLVEEAETRRESVKAGGLERRFAGLVALDEQDIEGGLKLFG